MKRVDMTNVQEAGSFQKVPAGPYICKITDVQDFPDREYLKISYDITVGDFAGYYAKTRKEHPDWAWTGAYVKSYKAKALPMFKRFCTAVSRSNGSFVFDGGAINSDEKTLVGKQIGLLMQEEEYYSNSGDIRTRLVINREFSVDKLSEQKTPDVRRLKEDAPQQATASTKNPDFMTIPEGSDEEVPW